ncbi:tetratricopeptide repeat protein [Flavobacterium sp.]|jgi:tetratricopeptide (TPR) repeat protein|uniref:tetratricopeptide repeat protein n=1 Tax=Flavobacterium sp. TaxID=239 RepID=UPI0037BF6915
MKAKIVFLLLISQFVFSQTNFEKAENLYDQGKYTLAKSLFETLLKENPNQLKTIEYLGDISVQLKEWDKAIAFYQKLKTLRPNEANYYYKYGGVLGLKSKEGGKWVAIRLIGDMKESFEKALLLDPKHIEARWAMIEYYLQVPALFGGSEKKAQRYADELIKLSPVDGYLSKAHIDEYFERYKSAEKYYIKAIELGGSKNTYERLASLYKVKLHNSEKAKKILEQYQEKNKS